MAGGTDEKWTNLGGEGRRHFQLVCGERVIDRLIRQLRERGISDIWIVCPDMPEYVIEGTARVAPRYAEWGHEALNGQHLWHESHRTIQLFGDTVFSESAMDIIVGFSRRTFQMFGSFGRGAIKGGGGELYAFSLWPEHREDWHDALEMALALKARGVIKRAGSWEGYRIMGGARGAHVGLHRLYPQVFTRIHDRLTDDFDTPAQFVKLRRLFEARAAA